MWISDGTATGTFPLTSFDRFGLLNLQSSRWAALGGKLIFTALVGGHLQLWSTDGTPAGTSLLLDPTSPDTVQLDSLVTLGNKVYFTTSGDSTKLWSSDGTPAGTSPVTDIGPSGAFDITAINGALYFFTVPQSPNWQLWKSDGTVGGTMPIVSFISTDTPAQLRPLNGDVTFTANDGVHGDELWASDGTAAGTALVKDTAFTSSAAHSDWLTNVNGTIYFATEGTSNQPQGLWKTDGSPAGTVLIREGAASNLVNWNGTLYFDATDAIHGNELWKSDGTPQGTVLVQDVEPGVVSSSPQSLTPAGNKLFFFRGDPTGDGSLWVTDGSPTGAVHLSNSVMGGSFRAMGSELYFRMSDSLWKSDGTPQGTVPVVPSDAAPISPTDLTLYNGQLYFIAVTGAQIGADYGLYRTDGTTAGTVLVKGGFDPYLDYPVENLAVADGSLYLTVHNNEIWKTDGTTAGTVVVTDLPLAQGNPAPSHFTALGDMLYFFSQDGSDRTGFTGLWKTDGTAAGTVKVRSVAAPPAIDTTGSFALAVGGELFFSTGADLWRSDGTPAGTYEVARPTMDLTSRPPSVMHGPPAVAVGSNLLFSLYDPAGARDLYSASAAPPAAPSGLIASAAASRVVVQLQWVNQSDNEAGFVIDRSRFADFSFIDKSFFARPNSTGYNDSDVLGGATYYYRVRAVDAGGDSAEIAAPPVTPHSVVAGRYVFYNNSLYDGRDPAANAADDEAVAPDKQALLPGQTATFTNYTSYSKGINGIMIDVAGLAGTPTAADFNLLVGSSGDLSTWAAAPAPLSVTLRPGAGAGGSSRLEIIWADAAITDRWLQVTLKADSITGLLAPDVFYFGNAIGESGNSPSDAHVDAADEAGARNDPHSIMHPATITNVHDYNRDGAVNAADQIIARNSAAVFNSGIALISAAPAAATTLLSQSDHLRTRLPKSRSRR